MRGVSLAVKLAAVIAAVVALFMAGFGVFLSAFIEDSMEQAHSRSDEQMGYYVAQAREVIDQSTLSQRELIEELRQLGRQEELFSAEAS